MNLYEFMCIINVNSLDGFICIYTAYDESKELVRQCAAVCGSAMVCVCGSAHGSVRSSVRQRSG
jgi:hypothetical protein